MNKQHIILLLALSVIIVALSTIVSATNLEDMNFNVSSEFKKLDDVTGLQFKDESNGIRIRIFDNKIGEWESGHSKYNKTVYLYNESIGGDEIEIEKIEEKVTSPKIIMFSYGEYIKIDGTTYWVEVSNDKGADEEPNYEKILESLEYFNEHNNFESVPI